MSKFLIGVLGATLALAACGSSSKSGSSGSSTTTAGGGNGNAVSSLVEKSKTSAFKVTYKTSTGDTITIAQDGKGKESVVKGDQLYINDGSTIISCDGTTSTATCRELGDEGKSTYESVTSAITDAAGAIARLGSSSLLNGQTSSETIAGRDATCVTVNATDMTGALGAIARGLGATASGSVCADNETGALLKVSGGSGDHSTDVFVATNFDQPSDSDFQPPSTPRPAPTVPSFTVPTIPNG
jgi:hypothetical protein